MPQVEEETTDEKRLRLARDIINEAKLLRKRRELDEAEEEETEEVTGILQHSLVIFCHQLVKRKMKFEQLLPLIKREDAARGFDRVELKGHKRPITCCKFVPLKQLLVSAGKDGSLICCTPR